MKTRLLLLSFVLLLVMGCTHNLRITNGDVMATSDVKPIKAVKIGFINSQDTLINSAIEETSLNAMVTETKKNCITDTCSNLDYLIELTNTMNYSASGENFLITFPGFLIFTHAWLGYKYNVAIDTQSKLIDSKGQVLSEQKISTPYEFRYTSFVRGATTSLVGWFTPGWGVIDVVPGMIFATSYDDRANNELIDKIKPSYKSFVSGKILEQIAQQQNAAAAPDVKASAAAKTVVVNKEAPLAASKVSVAKD